MPGILRKLGRPQAGGPVMAILLSAYFMPLAAFMKRR